MATEIISTGCAARVQPAAEGAWEAEFGDDGLAQAQQRRFAVPLEMHGWRMDRALAQLVPEFSRAYLQQLVAEGEVLLREVVWRKPAARVAVGDCLQVTLRPTLQAQAFVPQAMALDVVYEDADLLVINKPAGLVVHPAPGNWSGTLLNGLLAHHAGAAGLPRAGIVHRLDKETSGLMLVGKSQLAVQALVRAIAARTVKRQYLALAHGRWLGAPLQQVDQAIGRDSRNRLRMAVHGPDSSSGKTAQTTLQVLDSTEQACLLACQLHTGRTHQIRVHCAWLGHALVGDVLYGGRPLWGLNRQALHAARLRLQHPTGGQPLDFKAQAPADFLAALAQSGLRYNGAQWD